MIVVRASSFLKIFSLQILFGILIFHGKAYQSLPNLKAVVPGMSICSSSSPTKLLISRTPCLPNSGASVSSISKLWITLTTSEPI